MPSEVAGRLWRRGLCTSTRRQISAPIFSCKVAQVRRVLSLERSLWIAWEWEGIPRLTWCSIPIKPTAFLRPHSCLGQILRIRGNDPGAGRHLDYYHGFKCDHLEQHLEDYTTPVRGLFSESIGGSHGASTWRDR